MRLIIENFGPVKYADVTLGDFTVFIGPGGTGKSYLAYLIWMLQKLKIDWSYLVDEIYSLPEFIDVVLTVGGEYDRTVDGPPKFDENFAYRFLTKILNLVQEACNRVIVQHFKDTFRVSEVRELVKNSADFSKIEICNNSKTKCLTLRIDDDVRFEGFSKLIKEGEYLIHYDRYKGKLALKHNGEELNSVYVSPNMDIGEISGIVYDFVISIIAHIMFHNLDGYFIWKTSYILTDSKSGFLRFAPSLVRYALLEARRKEEFPIRLPDIHMLSELVVDRKDVKNKEISKIADFLERAIGGEVDIETEGLVFPEIFYRKEELVIPILRSHSGVRELAPLILYLRYVIENGKDSFIVIEEPETHLHPYMQSIVTRALAMLSKYAKVLITTHSPIILDELDNLIKLNILNSEEKRKLGYEDEEGLDSKSLKIYRFKVDGTVEEVKVTEKGIEEVEFSSVVAELSNKYANVDEAVWRKLYG